MQTDIFFNNDIEYKNELLNVIDECLLNYHTFIINAYPDKLSSEYRLYFCNSDTYNKDITSKQNYSDKIYTTRRKLNHIYEKAKQSFQNGVFLPLEYLFSLFNADKFVRYCVILSFLTEVDTRFTKLYNMFCENLDYGIPTIDFCIRTFSANDDEYHILLQQVYEKIDIFKQFFGFSFGKDKVLQAKLSLDRRIVDFLFNIESKNHELYDFCKLVYPSELNNYPLLSNDDTLDKILKSIDENNIKVYILYGSHGGGKDFLVKHVHKNMKKLCLFVDADRLVKHDDYNIINFIIREAVIKRAGICISNAHALFNSKKFEIQQTIEHILKYLPRVFITSDEKVNYNIDNIPVNIWECEQKNPDVQERMYLWENFLKSYNINQAIDIPAISAKFSFTAGQILNSIKNTVTYSNFDNKQINEEILYKHCRNQINHNLKDLATSIKCVYNWDDLILPEHQKDILKNACNQVRYYHKVYDEWGFSEKIAYGRGISMLFYGPPGTGKTMGAQVMAKTLKLELYKVDLSSVMSKYIGETEKNLGKIFDELKKSQSILFFDEADALFSKRSEVKDSNDKYSNAETAYLLQKIEEYEGIIILSTNYLQNFDEAFKRRIKHIIEFPLPNKNNRFDIWKSVWASKTPLSSDIDFEYLAERFEISGSNIKNIAVAAAFLAASNDTEISMKDILICLREEIKKAGKLLQKDDFGEYSDLF